MTPHDDPTERAGTRPALRRPARAARVAMTILAVMGAALTLVVAAAPAASASTRAAESPVAAARASSPSADREVWVDITGCSRSGPHLSLSGTVLVARGSVYCRPRDGRIGPSTAVAVLWYRNGVLVGSNDAGSRLVRFDQSNPFEIPTQVAEVVSGTRCVRGATYQARLLGNVSGIRVFDVRGPSGRYCG